MRLLMYLMLMQFACVMMSPVHKREGTGDLGILLQCPTRPSPVPCDPHTLLTKEQSSNFNEKLLQLKKSASCCLKIDESTGNCAESSGIKVNMVIADGSEFENTSDRVRRKQSQQRRAIYIREFQNNGPCAMLLVYIFSDQCVVVSSGLGVKVEEHFDMYDEFGAPCTSKTPGVNCKPNTTVDKTNYRRAAECAPCETPIWTHIAEIVMCLTFSVICAPICLYLKKKCTTGENATLAPTTTKTQERLLDETTANGHGEAKLNEN